MQISENRHFIWLQRIAASLVCRPRKVEFIMIHSNGPVDPSLVRTSLQSPVGSMRSSLQSSVGSRRSSIMIHPNVSIDPNLVHYPDMCDRDDWSRRTSLQSPVGSNRSSLQSPFGSTRTSLQSPVRSRRSSIPNWYQSNTNSVQATPDHMIRSPPLKQQVIVDPRIFLPPSRISTAVNIPSFSTHRSKSFYPIALDLSTVDSAPSPNSPPFDSAGTALWTPLTNPLSSSKGTESSRDAEYSISLPALVFDILRSLPKTYGYHSCSIKSSDMNPYSCHNCATEKILNYITDLIPYSEVETWEFRNKIRRRLVVIEDREEIEGDLIGKFDESSKDVLRREIVGLLVEFWEKLEERGERILEMVGSFEAYWGEGSWFRGVAKVKGELAEWEGCAEPIEELEPVEDF